MGSGAGVSSRMDCVCPVSFGLLIPLEAQSARRHENTNMKSDFLVGVALQLRTPYWNNIARTEQSPFSHLFFFLFLAVPVFSGRVMAIFRGLFGLIGVCVRLSYSDRSRKKPPTASLV